MVSSPSFPYRTCTKSGLQSLWERQPFMEKIDLFPNWLYDFRMLFAVLVTANESS